MTLSIPRPLAAGLFIDRQVESDTLGERRSEPCNDWLGVLRDSECLQGDVFVQSLDVSVKNLDLAEWGELPTINSEELLTINVATNDLPPGSPIRYKPAKKDESVVDEKSITLEPETLKASNDKLRYTPKYKPSKRKRLKYIDLSSYEKDGLTEEFVKGSYNSLVLKKSKLSQGYDFSCMTSCKSIALGGISIGGSNLELPMSIERFEIGFLASGEELDLSKYDQLEELTVKNLNGNIVLPSNLKKLSILDVSQHSLVSAENCVNSLKIVILGDMFQGEIAGYDGEYVEENVYR